jgi:hypothetical protein
MDPADSVQVPSTSTTQNSKFKATIRPDKWPQHDCLNCCISPSSIGKVGEPSASAEVTHASFLHVNQRLWPFMIPRFPARSCSIVSTPPMVQYYSYMCTTKEGKHAEGHLRGNII